MEITNIMFSFDESCPWCRTFLKLNSLKRKNKVLLTDSADPIQSGNGGVEAKKVATEERNSKSGSPFLKVRMLQQAAEMIFWRVFALAFGAVGSIWGVRCLGPENVGISGMVAATVAQAVLVVELNQNTIFVRHYKRQNSEAERSILISAVFTFRLVLCAVLALAAILILFSIGISAKWHVAIIAGVPLLFFSSNQSVWVLQAQENLPANYRAIAIPSIVSACLYFSFFRPGIGPGLDVIVQAVAQAAAFSMGWYYALYGRHQRLVRRKVLLRLAPLLKEGRWLMLTGLVFYLYTSFDLPLTGYLLPLHELGQYRAATKLSAVTQSFLSIAPLLLYPRLLEWSKVGTDYLWKRQKKIVLTSFCILIPLSIMVFLLSSALFKIVYGAAFLEAATPCALLLIARFVGVIRAILCCGLWAQDEDKKVTGLIAAVAATSLVSYLILIPRMGILGAAFVNLASETLAATGAFCLARTAGTQMSASGTRGH